METIYKTVYFRDKFTNFENANLSIANSAMLYGLSTYSVMPVYLSFDHSKLNLFRIEDHYKRLSNSSKILGFNDFEKNYSLSSFKKLIHRLLIQNNIQSDSLVRMTIFVDAILAGSKSYQQKTSLAIFVYPMTPLIKGKGASLMVSSWNRIADNAIPARAKVNGAYVNSALMKNEALRLGYDDAIALDRDGHVTESTISNIFIVRNKTLITSGLASDVLEGITRNSIALIAAQLGIPLVERSIDRTELYLAEEAFLCGSSLGIFPIFQIDHTAINNQHQGPLTIKIKNLYQNIVRSKTVDVNQWIESITL
jgi:branched-chain amino acid aminotransferase